MSVQRKICKTVAAKAIFLKFWCDPIFLVENYIKAYSGEQVQIPSLYDGPFKVTNNASEIDEELLPPKDKKIPKVGRPRRKRHSSRGEVGGPRKNRTVSKPPAADGLWGLTGVSMNDEPEPACGFETNHEGTEAAEIDLIIGGIGNESDTTQPMDTAVVTSADTSDIESELALLEVDLEEPTKESSKVTRNSGEEGDIDDDEIEGPTNASQRIITALAPRKAFIKHCLVCGEHGHTLKNCHLNAETSQPDGNDGKSSPKEDSPPIQPRRSGRIKKAGRVLGGRGRQLRRGTRRSAWRPEPRTTAGNRAHCPECDVHGDCGRKNCPLRASI
jgi:hypothetical protein